jgi:hypothetical protein
VFVWVIVLVAITGSFSMAEEPWRQEMDAVCSRTQDSMSLSLVELKQLVERCDKLKPTIEAQEESTRKVFRKRLQLCRDLYAFVLKSREQEKK